MYRKSRVLGTATLKRKHGGGEKLPSDFLMSDRHTDVLSDSEFKSLWWKLQETTTSTKVVHDNKRMVLSIVQNCAAYRVLHVKQLISILKLFDNVDDRLEVLEMFTLRSHKLMYKADLIPLFTVPLRPYVATILDRTMLVEPTEGVVANALLFVNKLKKSKQIVRGIVAALERVHYNRTNQNEVVTAMLKKDAKPMSHRQAYRILYRFVDDCETMLTVIELIDRFVVGFTCREAALLISDIKSLKFRVQVLKKLGPLILDSEHRWITLDSGFDKANLKIREQVAQHLQTWTIRPRSWLFGTVTGNCVCFVIDTSSSMEATLVTNQSERISRLRFVVKELCIVLKHQLKPTTMFNIVAFNRMPLVFSDGGPLEASILNVLAACNWLRMLKPSGPTYTTLALEAAFKCTGTSIDEVYVITDGDPSNGIDFEMELFQTTVIPWIKKCEMKPRINVTAIVLGSHHSDDVKKTEDYAYDLATAGGGLCRFLVDDSYQKAKKQTKFITVERATENICSSIGYQVIYVISFLTMCFTIYFTEYHSDITGRRTYLDIISMIPTFLNPDPSVFRFWIVALCLQGVMVLQMLRIPLCCRSKKNEKDDNVDEDDGDDSDDSDDRDDRDDRDDELINEKDSTIILLGQMKLLTWKVPILHGLTSLWVISVQSELLLLSLMISFLHLIILSMLHISLEIGKHPMKHVSLEEQLNDNSSAAHNTTRNGILWSERLFLNIPISVNLAWTSFCVCLQFAQYMASWEWFGFGWSEEWAIILIIFLGILGVLMSTIFDDSLFAMVMAFCLLGTAQNNFRKSSK
jgi:hypothetical protein